MIGATEGGAIFFFFLFVYNFLFFPHGGKGGVRRGTRRGFEHRHSVYIYQNFFAFNRAIAIKCVHVTVVVSAVCSFEIQSGVLVQ